MEICRTAVLAATLTLLAAAADAAVVTTHDLAVLEANTGTTVVIEDYESQPFGPIGDFSSGGITHTNLNTAPGAELFIGDPSLNGAPALFTSRFLTANGNEMFQLHLDTPTQVLGFDTFTNAMGPVLVMFLDASSNVLDVTLIGGGDTQPAAGFLGVISQTPIATFRWQAMNGEFVNTGIDNIRIGSLTASVPAPAGAALLLIGLAALRLRSLQRRGVSRPHTG